MSSDAYTGESRVACGRVWDTPVAANPEVAEAMHLGGGIGDGRLGVIADTSGTLRERG